MTNKDSKQIALDLTAIEGNPKVHTAKDFIENPTEEEKQKTAESLDRAVEMINNNTQLRETFNKTVDSLKQLLTEYTETSNVYKSYLIDRAKNNPEFYYQIIEQVIATTLAETEQEETIPVRFNDFTECVDFFKDMLTNELTIAKDYNLDFNRIATILRHSFNRLGIESTQLTAELLLSRLEAEEEAKHKFNLNLHMFGEEPELAKQAYIRVDKFHQDLTKSNLAVFNKPIDELAQMQIDISPNNKSKTKNLAVILDVIPSQDENVKIPEGLTQLDESVYDGVISLLEAGYRSFTPQRVANFINYGNGPGKVSRSRVEAVTKSIDKMRFLEVHVNWTDHARLNNIFDNTQGYIESNALLPLKKGTFIDNGAKVEGYMFLDTPPLHNYAKQVKQVSTIRAELLNAPFRQTDEKIAMRDYMLKQIAHMKNNPNWNKTMTLSKIFEQGGKDVKEVSKQQRQKDIKALEAYLKHWIDNKEIEGYKINKRSGANHSITIIL